MRQISKDKTRRRIHQRIRNRLRGTSERPRLNVYRSVNHIYVQVIDDTAGTTLVSASSNEATEAKKSAAAGKASAVKKETRPKAEASAAAEKTNADSKAGAKSNGNKRSGGNLAAAKTVGKLIAERAQQKGVKKVVFDRGGYLYHGRVKALADAAREAGLEF